MERYGLLAGALIALAGCAARVSPTEDAAVADRVDVTAGCARSEDCDDGVGCTADTCRAGRCERVALDARCAPGDRCDLGLGCRDPRCPPGQRACPVPGGALRCVDTRTDRAHCGACERPCGLGEGCAAGVCAREPGAVGARCVADPDCGEGLRCDEGLNGLCSRACEDLGDDDQGEALACGAEGRRCVRGEPAARCQLGCDPRARPGSTGACRVGEVCTGGWWLDPQYLPDAPGCVRWCSSDADCAGDARGARCNPRLGRCAAVGEDRAQRPDGFPCDPRATMIVAGDSLPRSAECRGRCFALRVGGAEGVCGSYVDGARFSRCPDDGDVIAPRGPFGADNLTLCLWRRCVTDCGCPTGLRCLLPEGPQGPLRGEPRLCSWPTSAQPTGVPCGRI
jgi:hypothetical protein